VATERTSGLTYDDLLEMFPEEDNLRRELIGGELIVTPAPTTGHQRVVMLLSARLFAYAEEHGGEVYPAPTDVFFTDRDVVEPDVVFVRAEHLERIEPRFIRSAPAVVVEVSSPSTRALELTRKLRLYEEHGVPEYWYVDLDADRIEVYRLGDEGYGAPALLGDRDELTSPLLPGFGLRVNEILGAAAR
jgi:Uma2 family endonuclease